MAPGCARKGMSKARLRRSTKADLERIWTLVGTVVCEVYGRVLPAGFTPEMDPGWEGGWVAEDAGRIVAVMLTDAQWLDDLWVDKEHRGRNLGRRLLTLAEEEIAARGHDRARLRVVAENVAAILFYAAHGWREERRYPHEKHGFEMVEMIKDLDSLASRGRDSTS